MSVIPESGMNFGKYYDEKDLFHIETSEIYKKLGDGIPTVEFILKYNGYNITYLGYIARKIKHLSKLIGNIHQPSVSAR